MTDLMSPPPELVRHRMMTELADDTQFRGYPHDPTEVAQVVSGLAIADCEAGVEYLPSSDDVCAIAEYVALELGVNDFVTAGELARNMFLEHTQPKVVS